MPIKPLEIEDIESKAGNIYEAVVIAAKRARQINDEEKLEYSQRIQPIIEQEVEDESVVSKDKQNVSLDFEVRKKNTERGLEELMSEKLEFRLRSDEVEEEEE
jgi:DNA-directed RNA polymerase omega subunit